MTFLQVLLNIHKLFDILSILVFFLLFLKCTKWKHGVIHLNAYNIIYIYISYIWLPASYCFAKPLRIVMGTLQISPICLHLSIFLGLECHILETYKTSHHHVRNSHIWLHLQEYCFPVRPIGLFLQCFHFKSDRSHYTDTRRIICYLNIILNIF